VPGCLELGLEVRRLDRLAVGALVEVEHHSRAQEPVERQLVYRPRGLAGDRRVVVVGRVEMGRVVGPEAGEELDRPALPVAQQLGGHAERLLDLGRAGGVVLIVDLGAEELGRF
jgi:hypothetical protein